MFNDDARSKKPDPVYDVIELMNTFRGMACRIAARELQALAVLVDDPDRQSDIINRIKFLHEEANNYVSNFNLLNQQFDKEATVLMKKNMDMLTYDNECLRKIISKKDAEIDALGAHIDNLRIMNNCHHVTIATLKGKVTRMKRAAEAKKSRSNDD